MSHREIEPPAASLELDSGMRTGSTNLVHVTFIPTHLLVRPVAGTADRHDTTSLDAHRFDASLAEAEAAIEEWHSFVEEIRARKVRPSS